jgi:DNA-directed RNA polymerase subunit K/omega
VIDAGSIGDPEEADVDVTPTGEPADGAFSNRFLLVTVACRRVSQIRGGSRARVDAGSHKPVVLAVAEVLAGCVPYIIPQ